MNNFDNLSEKIEGVLKAVPFAKIMNAANELSQNYRAQTDGMKSAKPFMFKEEHKMAYLALRMPATYAAIYEVLKHIPDKIDSLLDVGSGPGTAFWSAKHHFPGLKEAVLIEKDPDLIRLGTQLLEGASGNVRYQKQDMKELKGSKTFDLVTACYALSELSENALVQTVQELWKATGRYFCIVEPGTPYGFKTILKVRSSLIQEGAHILAPCTHERACPWQDGADWCHFSTRFERTALQRRVKSATLGYEDEKYSYLIVSKQPVERPYSRIVKTPIKRSGFLQLTLCNKEGLENKTLSKKDKETYQSAKKLEWGDGY